MKGYIVLMYCAEKDLRSYAPEVLTAIESVAGKRYKYAEGASGVVTIGMATDKAWADVFKAFTPLWRKEQRCWVFPAPEEHVLMDKALLDWFRKQA